MVLLGIVQATLAHPDEVPSISNGRQLVEAMSERFPHEDPRGGMVCADTSMDVEEQLLPFPRGDALEKYLRGALAIELPTHDLIAFGMWYQPMGVSNIVGKDLAFEEVKEGCHPVLLVSKQLGRAFPGARQ